MMRVVVVGGSPALQAGLRALLQSADREAEIVAAPADGPDPRDPADHVWLLGAARLLTDGWDGDRPTLVLAADGAEQLNAAHALRRQMRAGWGVVPEGVQADQLVSALRAVAHGLVVLPARAADQLLPIVAPSAVPAIVLTGREHEVLALLGRGLPNKSIALELGISEATAKFHASAIYAKLGASSRADAVSRAARAGLITL
jgi:DNA-binding CsgD family transcriptional regulator